MESERRFGGVARLPRESGPDAAPVTGIEAHHLMLFAVLVLIGIGLVMVFSSSFVVSERSMSQDGYQYVRRQLSWTGLSLLAFWVAAQIPMPMWRRAAPWIVAGSIVCLLLLFVPGLAASGKNVRRWLRLGGIGFQPSEMAKIALILGLAWLLTRESGCARRFTAGFLACLGLIAAVTAPILVQPDVGTALFIAAVGLTLSFLAGVRLLYLMPAGAVALPTAFLLAFTLFPHVRQRLDTFLRPDADLLGKGHQVNQALIGLGAGGDFGVGLGLSRQKLYYLPERHTDFIFAVVGEELGLAGSLLIILLFATVVLCMRRVADRAPDSFAFLAASGMMLLVGFQAVMNIAVVTGMIPPKGISLPFVSYGGSGLVAMMTGVGIVYGIGRSGSRIARPAHV